MIGEFMAHDSRPHFGNLNRRPPAMLNASDTTSPASSVGFALDSVQIHQWIV
jgi:hypothetical protein